MSGHSKWSTIKRDKEKEDAKRGTLFSKHAREIIVAAKLAGGDPNTNLRLRRAIKSARDISMPKDKITDAIKRGTGEVSGKTYEEVTYEGYGTGGVAILIECLTDNKARTIAQVRLIFQKAGGSIGEKGSVSWIFTTQNQFTFDKALLKQNNVNIDHLEEVAIDAGAEDFKETTENLYILTPSKQSLLEQLQAAGYQPTDHCTFKKASNQIALDENKTKKVLQLIKNLNHLEDVQNVYSNLKEDE